MPSQLLHPRPDFMRDTFLSLDGSWRFAFDDEDVGLAERWFEYGHSLPMTIQVPFAYQCEMSGIHGDIGGDAIHPIIWYRRGFTVPDEMSGRRVLVKFIAVDWACTVWVNGVYVGGHEGGYTPFACDITSALHSDPTKENDLCLRVVDMPDMAQPRGKQYWRRGLTGCWYTPVSGIWQSVYLESVPVDSPMITRVHVTPDVDKGTATIAVSLDRAPAEPLSITFGLDMTVEDGMTPNRPTLFTASMKEREASFTADMRGAAHDDPFAGVRFWSPEHPDLYGLTVEIGGDRVHTYFGMRKIEARDSETFLNNTPLRQRLVLDQGYWPKSNLTAPSDDALKSDIEWTLRFGFNGARKHQKIESPRWYYWADKLGLLVWGELPSAYVFTPSSTRALMRTMEEFIDRDYNHPCVITWTPLNESWGVPQILTDSRQQAFARQMYELCQSLDGTRLVSGNDGWEQVLTDVFALHDYAQDGGELREHMADRETINRVGMCGKAAWADGAIPDDDIPFLLTEYGGTAFDNKGAQGEMGGMATWGYGTKISGEEAFLARFAKIQRSVYATPFCKGACYTQLTDVMQEINGLLSPQREPKVDPERFAKLNRGEGIEQAG